MNRPYLKCLTPEEREASVELGAALCEARFVKRAGIVGTVGDTGLKTLIYTSIVAGVPLGIAAHIVAAKIKARNRKEREMQAKIDYYRRTGQAVETELARQGATVEPEPTIESAGFGGVV